MKVMERLVAHRKWRLARELMLLYGLDIPAEVTIGDGLVLQHRGMGTVIHPDTRIGKGVTIFHGVTVGRRDAHVPRANSPMVDIVIGDGAILYPGACILGGPGTTTVGSGTIIAANAVLLASTGDDEVWAGNPARKVGVRK